VAEITTALVHENEIAKAEDFLHGFTSLVKNTAVLDRMLVSANIDYIIGGEVFPDSVSFGIRVGRLWGNGNGLDLPVFLGDISEAIPLIRPMADNRIDTLQVKCEFEEYDRQRRAFYNPDLTVGQYFVVPTKMRLKTILEVKQGVEGQDVAPDADTGWIKLAEICLEPGMITLPEENIKNITAIFQSEENKAWTNQKNRTFNLGSLLDMKTMFAKEHNSDGTHRDQVIHKNNIDFGIGANQVNGTNIPLGDDYEEGNDTFEATDSLHESLIKEMLYRRANHAANQAAIQQINQVISQIHIAIDGLMPKAPGDGPVYGGKNKTWVEIEASGGGGHDGNYHELYKVFSKKTLMITNTRIVDRRKRRWDIGLPYLSPASRAYHFDTDLLDQNQTSNLETGYAGEAPALVDNDQTNGQVYFNPAVLAIVPHEMKGRSLYGHFSIRSKPQTSTETATAEMWVRLFENKSAIILSFGTGMEKITFQTGTRGAAEAAYGAAEADDILDGAGEPPIAYSFPEADGIGEGTAETDGIVYGKADDPLPYSEAGTDIGNAIIHEALDGTHEIASLDDIELTIARRTWLHIAAVSTPDTLSFFIGGNRIEFNKISMAGPLAVGINPAKHEFNLDELMLDEVEAANFDQFTANTAARIPWAALDYTEKHFVLEAQDPALVHTNIFESEQFREAVYAAIDARS
jgi:hypothetical protein